MTQRHRMAERVAILDKNPGQRALPDPPNTDELLTMQYRGPFSDVVVICHRWAWAKLSSSR